MACFLVYGGARIHCLLQRQEKCVEEQIKALKARNEYLMSIDAANSSTQKYFTDDLSLVIDVSITPHHNPKKRL